MIRIGKLTDYSLLVMSQLAKEPDLVTSASSLAETLHLSPPTVSKILKMLSDSSLVTSVRGAEGGYLLAKPAEKITVCEIIEAMEGGLAMTECCESTSLCAIDSVCTLRGNWRTINKMVQELLAGFTIVDMLKPISVRSNHGK
jgi:FeS assembly SUF system regulator